VLPGSRARIWRNARSAAGKSLPSCQEATQSLQHAGEVAHEVRQWVSNGSTFTCAAFAPDGSFAVTGTEDRQVLVWSVPPPEELDRQIPAELPLVERAVESGGNPVRLWAEFDNPRGPTRLLPGTPVTLVIPPTEPQF
jgi:hypothetical protein